MKPNPSHLQKAKKQDNQNQNRMREKRRRELSLHHHQRSEEIQWLCSLSNCRNRPKNKLQLRGSIKEINIKLKEDQRWCYRSHLMLIPDQKTT